MGEGGGVIAQAFASKIPSQDRVVSIKGTCGHIKDEIGAGVGMGIQIHQFVTEVEILL